MEAKLIVMIALIAMLVLIVTVGIILKVHTVRKLKDIDGLGGIVKKGEFTGKPLSINIVEERGTTTDE